MSRMGKVVVTGAGGYIGGRLVEVLAVAGWRVHALVRERAPYLRVEQSVCHLASPECRDVLASALRGAQTVVHLAGENEIGAAADPVGALTRTVAATQHVAAACAAASVRRLVYLSTVHVYGAQMTPGATLTEDMRVEPRSTYAISRLASEHIAAATNSYELVVLRLTNCVGAPRDPRVDRWSLVVNDLCRQGAVRGELTLRSSGMQWRDFVPLGSVCAAISAAAWADPPQVRAWTYNLGSGKPMTVRAVAEMVRDALEEQTGRRPNLRAPTPERTPLAACRVAVDRLRREGVTAGGALECAVLETVSFCVANRQMLS